MSRATLNILAMVLTIGFGTIGWLWPRYTMGVLDLTTDGSTLGLSEIRAASGALFVGLGLCGLLLRQPAAFVTVGAAYLGAATGRLTSILLDGSGSVTAWSFFAVEIGLGLYLAAANLARPAT